RHRRGEERLADRVGRQQRGRLAAFAVGRVVDADVDRAGGLRAGIEDHLLDLAVRGDADELIGRVIEDEAMPRTSPDETDSNGAGPPSPAVLMRTGEASRLVIGADLTWSTAMGGLLYGVTSAAAEVSAQSHSNSRPGSKRAPPDDIMV